MHNYGSGAVWLMGVILSILPILCDINFQTASVRAVEYDSTAICGLSQFVHTKLC